MTGKKKQLKYQQVLLLVIIGILSACCSSIQNKEVYFYISTEGNDNWSGKLAEANSGMNDGPFATLEGARIAVRKYTSEKASGLVTIYIRGGEYELDSTIIFGPEDSGTKEFPIYYRAYPNEIPVFTGGKKLYKWKKCENEPPGISEKAKGNLWYHEIPEELN